MATIETETARAIVEEEIGGRPVSWRWQALGRLAANRSAMIGLGLLLLMILLALLAPLIARYDPNAINVDILNQNPSGRHWFGTDYLGRDMWSRVLWGGRISLIA